MSSGVAFPFRVFEIFFLASLVLFPFFFGSVDLWVFSLAAVVSCGAFAFHWFAGARREPVLRSGLDIWIAVYVLLFLLSLGFSKIPYLSWVEFFKLDVVLCAFVATRYLCRERRQIRRTAETLAFLGALLSIIGLLQFAGGLPNGWWGHPQFLSSMYVNHNHFAGLLVLLLPVTFGLVLAERSRAKKVLFIFMIVLMSVAFVFALSRGALISLSAAMLWMWWTLKKRRLAYPSVLPFVLVAILVLGAVVIFGTESIEQRIENIRVMTEKEDLSLRFRWLTWLGTLPMIWHFFWFGSGPGTFGHVFLQFRPSGFSMRPVHTHNDALQLLAECGVFAFVAVALILIVFFVLGLKVVWRDESRLRIGLGSGILAGILGVLVHSMFDFNFHIPANLVLASVVGALLLTMGKRETYGPRLSVFLRRFISTLLAAAIAGGLYFGVSHYGLWKAKRLLKEGDKKSAIEAVERSLNLNPFDAEGFYLRGYMRALDDAASSAKDLDRAISLNRYEPVYDLAKARALVPRLAEASPGELVGFFEKALEKDPNNETLAFIVARETFGRRGPQFSPLRALAGKMLERNPAAFSGLIGYLEQSDHWQYHRRYHLKREGLDPDRAGGRVSSDRPYRAEGVSYSPKDFSTSGGEPFGKEGVLYSNAVVTKNIEVYNPLLLLELECYGSPAKGVYPALYVKIDGKLVDEYYINSKAYKIYSTSLKLIPGTHILSIEYVNDLRVGGPSPEDRNVWIRRVSLRETAQP